VDGEWRGYRRFPRVGSGRLDSRLEPCKTGDTFSARVRVDSSSTGPSRQPSPASVARSSTHSTCSANRSKKKLVRLIGWFSVSADPPALLICYQIIVENFIFGTASQPSTSSSSPSSPSPPRHHPHGAANTGRSHRLAFQSPLGVQSEYDVVHLRTSLI
jgi:hypothetical protein